MSAVFTSSGNAVFMSTAATAAMDILAVTNLAATSLFVVEQSGEVGVGTASPAFTLDVAGTGNFTGAFTITTAAGYAPFTVGTDTIAVVGGYVGVGTATPGQGDKAAAMLSIFTSAGIGGIYNLKGRATAGGAELYMDKSRATDETANTVVQDGDDLATIFLRGADGTGFIDAAQILAEVDGTPGTNDMPGRLSFLTTPDGSATLSERMRITSAGNIVVNTAQAYTSTFTSVGYQAVVSSETLTAGAVITANACGGTKVLYAAGAVATDTTNTFTAPAAANTGCVMRVCATTLGGNITLDNNANFKSAAGADVVLTTDDCIEVTQIGTVWVQTSALLAN